MWHLEFLSKDKEEEYYNIIKDKMIEARDSLKDEKQKNYLTDENLKLIVLKKPSELYDMVEELKENLYIEGKCMQEIYDLFNYKKFISSNKEVSYKIANLIGVNCCVYCNRQYTLTIEKDGSKIVRPEFDHFFPKKKYPFFALSLYNLIPSCHICNSNCKGEKVVNRNLNPYATLSGKDFFKFSYKLKPDGGYEVFTKDLKEINEDHGKAVKKYLECFKIEEIYNGHANTELKDLILLTQKYSESYIKEILPKNFGGMTIEAEEAYRLIFGTEAYGKNDQNRPFSKFKRDILKELGIIK